MPISASAAPNRAPISRGACSDRAAPELRGRRQRNRGCLPRRRSLTDAGHSPAGRALSDTRELSLRLARKRPSSRAVRSPLWRAAGSKGSRAISRRRPVAVSRGIPPRPSLSLIARWRRVRSGLRGLQARDRQSPCANTPRSDRDPRHPSRHRATSSPPERLAMQVPSPPPRGPRPSVRRELRRFAGEGTLAREAGRRRAASSPTWWKAPSRARQARRAAGSPARGAAPARARGGRDACGLAHGEAGPVTRARGCASCVIEAQRPPATRRLSSPRGSRIRQGIWLEPREPSGAKTKRRSPFSCASIGQPLTPVRSGKSAQPRIPSPVAHAGRGSGASRGCRSGARSRGCRPPRSPASRP